MDQRSNNYANKLKITKLWKRAGDGIELNESWVQIHCIILKYIYKYYKISKHKGDQAYKNRAYLHTKFGPIFLQYL